MNTTTYSNMFCIMDRLSLFVLRDFCVFPWSSEAYFESAKVVFFTALFRYEGGKKYMHPSIKIVSPYSVYHIRIFNRWVRNDLSIIRIFSCKPIVKILICRATIHNITFNDRTHAPNPQEIYRKFPEIYHKFPPPGGTPIPTKYTHAPPPTLPHHCSAPQYFQDLFEYIYSSIISLYFFVRLRSCLMYGIAC